MDIEIILNICRELPHVTEDIKWGDDLCSMIGGKMFCVTTLSSPLKVSLKVTHEEFGEMATLPGIFQRHMLPVINGYWLKMPAYLISKNGNIISISHITW